MDKHTIRTNAGVLWRLLSTDPLRRWKLEEIKELTNLNDAELARAVGWLAREDKIQLEYDDHSSKEQFESIGLISNFYF